MECLTEPLSLTPGETNGATYMRVSIRNKKAKKRRLEVYPLFVVYIIFIMDSLIFFDNIVNR